MASLHFSDSEISCNCCGQGADKVSPRLLELLEQLRYNIGGLPLFVSCVYRCESHNKDVGGVPNSQHVLGTAADVLCPDHLSMGEFQWYVEQIPFDAIGIYKDAEFIHVDVREGGIGAGYYWEG